MYIVINTRNDVAYTNKHNGDYFFTVDELIEMFFNDISDNLIIDVDTGKAYHLTIALEEE